MPRARGALPQITGARGEAVASVVVDRLLGVVSLVVLGVAGVLACGAGLGRGVGGSSLAVAVLVGGLCRRVLGRRADPRGGARPTGMAARNRPPPAARRRRDGRVPRGTAAPWPW